MRYTLVVLLACAACSGNGTEPPRSELPCADGSVAPLRFQQYVRVNGADVDSFAVENRVSVPHRYADTIFVFDGGARIILAKSGGRCQTLFDSLLARFNPPIVKAMP